MLSTEENEAWPWKCVCPCEGEKVAPETSKWPGEGSLILNKARKEVRERLCGEVVRSTADGWTNGPASGRDRLPQGNARPSDAILLKPAFSPHGAQARSSCFGHADHYRNSALGLEFLQ